MKISAIVSTYNAADFLPGRLENLLSQTMINDMEIIVIDSGSEQNEGEIVRRFQARHEYLIYERTAHDGLYATWNRAIQMARGQYLVTANTDDRSREDAYELLARSLDSHENIALVYSDFFMTRNIEDILASQQFHADPSWKRIFMPVYTHRDLLLQCLCGPQPMWRRAIHDEIGMFDDSFKIAGDYEFWLRLAEKYALVHIAEPLALFYENPQGLSRSNPDLLKQEATRIRRQYLSMGR